MYSAKKRKEGIITKNKFRKSFCGTLEYMAPEILRHEYYNTNADIWSLGILLYEMMHGQAPFKGCGYHRTMMKILDGEISFDESIQSDAREVINVILNSSHEERPKPCEILEIGRASCRERVSSPV